MTSRRALTIFGVAAVAFGTGLTGAAPAAAGGIGDFLSPAFGTSCGNLNNGAHADGVTSHGAGTGGGNLAGLPLGGALNQCGGADLDPTNMLTPAKNVLTAQDIEGAGGVLAFLPAFAP